MAAQFRGTYMREVKSGGKDSGRTYMVIEISNKEMYLL
jgi:hypothetical protein